MEDTIPMARPSDRAWSSASAGPSGTLLAAEDVETEDLGSVESKGEGQLMEKGK